MFIGHWSASFAAAARPKGPSLASLFIGAQLIDWGFFTLLLTGTEHMRLTPGISAMSPLDLYDMPYTHSLLGACIWGVAFGLVLAILYRSVTAFVLGAAVVVSHWLLDLFVHIPDLTLAGQPPKYGFGLWNHPPIEMPLEIGLLLLAAWFWFWRSGRGWRGIVPFVVLIVALLGLQAFNWFGPVATEVTPGTSYLALAAYGAATLLAWWAERSRQRLRR
jgi:hypothetical protein